MNRYFGYVRVSSVKQGEGVSLAEQRQAIEEYARRHKLRIVEWFEEKETAAKRGRPVFRAMLKKLRRGDADGVVSHKIDRSARNLRDWSDLDEFMDEGRVRFAHESLDLTTRGGRLAADIQAVVAADFIRNLSEETRKGQRGRLRQGLYPFAAPVGYLDSGAGKPKAIDPILGPLVREAFERYATGLHSIGNLASIVHRLGLRTRGGGRVHKPYLARVLRNPFYAGTIKIQSTGETFAGSHEALIPRSLFDAVQALIDGRSVGGARRHRYLYRRLFRCGACDCYLVGERQKGRVYYRCHTRGCPSRTVREDRISARLHAELGRISFTPAELKHLEQRLAEMLGGARKNVEAAVAALRRELGAHNSRLARLTELFVDGELDKDAFHTAKESLLAKQARLEERLAELERDPAAAGERARDALELASSAQRSLQEGNRDQKRRIVESVCSNRTLSGNELSVELAFPFSEIVFSPCVLPGCSDQDVTRTPEQLDSIVETLRDWATDREVRAS